MKNEILIPASNENATVLFRDALKKCVAGKENVIRFENSVYHFSREGAYCGMFYPIYNQKSEKYVNFPLFGVENLTIDGNGATFLFEDRVYPFIAQNAKNLSFQNFTVDFSFPRYCNTRVEHADENGFSLRILQDDLDCWVNEKGNVVFRSGSDFMSTGKKKYFLQSNKDHCYLITGETNADVSYLAAKLVTADAAKDGSLLSFTYTTEERLICEPGDLLTLSFDEDRENSVFFLEECKNVRFDHVSIIRGAGFGILAQLSDNITIENCVMAIPENRKKSERISITADLIHMVHCTGTIRIENNRLEDCLDDAINIHGQYMRMKKFLSADRVELEFCHPTHGCRKLYEPGDRLVVSDPESFLEKTQLIVRSVNTEIDGKNIKMQLQFTENLPECVSPGDLLENPECMPVILIRNNRILRCPHIRLSSSRYMEVSGNQLELTCCGVYISDLEEYWFESGRVKNVLIEKNHFLDSSAAGLADGVTMEHSTGNCEEYYHENITIRDNVFELKNGTTIHAKNVDGLMLQNNTFLSGKPVEIMNCKNIIR